MGAAHRSRQGQAPVAYDPKRSLETYLFTILRYKITDYLRSSSSGVSPEKALVAWLGWD